jgi:histidyl-tRNA synthetase
LEEYERKGFARDTIRDVLGFGRTRGPPDEVCKRLEAQGLGPESTGGAGTVGDDGSSKDGDGGGLFALRDSLRSRGIENVEYNLSIVRGLDYYTGVVFEVVDTKHPDLGSLCGGGRYDVLPRLFGRPDLSATGAAGGVERIALSMQRSERAVATGGGLSPVSPPPPPPSVYVAFTELGLAEKAIETVSSLRRGGIRSEVGARGKSLGKQMEDASSRGFTWVVIIGRKELASKELVLRNMHDRAEERVPIDGLLSRLRAEGGA